MKDRRPDPKPRKNPHLWQSYLWWDELVQMRKRHTLRLDAAAKGKSHMDPQFERDVMDEMQLDALVDAAKKTMIAYGQLVGPIWEAVTSIKGLGAGGLAAQLLAQIDDAAKFDTVSKLWRFAGYAVIDGRAERNRKGKKSHFNRYLKSIVYLVGDQFVKQQTPGYVGIYYSEKERIRAKYPEPVPAENGPWSNKYTDSHVHRMALRKMNKIFLQHLWLVWRESEGLEVSDPYVHDKLGHTSIITPQDCGWPAEIVVEGVTVYPR